MYLIYHKQCTGEKKNSEKSTINEQIAIKLFPFFLYTSNSCCCIFYEHFTVGRTKKYSKYMRWINGVFGESSCKISQGKDFLFRFSAEESDKTFSDYLCGKIILIITILSYSGIRLRDNTKYMRFLNIDK